jgi:hypothetical protein
MNFTLHIEKLPLCESLNPSVKTYLFFPCMFHFCQPLYLTLTQWQEKLVGFKPKAIIPCVVSTTQHSTLYSLVPNAGRQPRKKHNHDLNLKPTLPSGKFCNNYSTACGHKK